jgi:hypothetical protein
MRTRESESPQLINLFSRLSALTTSFIVSSFTSNEMKLWLERLVYRTNIANYSTMSRVVCPSLIGRLPD